MLINAGFEKKYIINEYKLYGTFKGCNYDLSIRHES